MSHVVDVHLKVTDVEAMERACEALGAEFHQNATTFRSSASRVASAGVSPPSASRTAGSPP